MPPTSPRKRDGINATVLPDGRWLLYHPSANIAVTLNAPAGILWELCDGQNSIDAIVAELAGYYPDVQPDTLTQEVTHMLHALYDQGLMAPDAQS